MKRLLIITGAVIWSLSGITGPSWAQVAPPASDPLLSMKRLSIAAGIESELMRDYASGEQHWFGVIPLAYNLLSPPKGEQGFRLSLTARASQSFDLKKRPELFVGARVTLWRGAP